MSRISVLPPLLNVHLWLQPIMPWNEFYYPRSMEHLPPLVRSKAIEIANALLEEGYEEGMAIRIAIAKAKEWAERRGFL